MKKLLAHPVTQRTRTIVRRVVITGAVILAVAFVTSVTVDLGPSLKRLAEERGSEFMGRTLHIGRMSVRLLNARFEFNDLRIEGLTPSDRPFFTAKRIFLSMRWSTLLGQRIVFDEVTITDWKMLVEQMPNDGPISFPRIRSIGGGGRSGWTTTVPWVRAHRGEFVYEDHGTPWSVAARNIDITIVRPATEYLGTANFSGGTVAIQDYKPFAAAMRSTFKIEDGRILLNRIDLRTDGARTLLNGDVNMRYWPEQMFQLRSTIDFSKMREIFFARDRFTLAGTGAFEGTFHLFRDRRANGEPRMGRELKGVITSVLPGVNAHQFQNLRAPVVWTPDRLSVADASADFYGGAARFAYQMAPLGRRDERPTHRFDTELENVDLKTYTDFIELQGMRLAGQVALSHSMEWPSGGWSARHGRGQLMVSAPAGATLQTRRLPPQQIGEREAREVREAGRDGAAPFSAHTPVDPVPVAGLIAYAFTPDAIEIGPSQLASAETYVEFDGRTSWSGAGSQMPFHITSSDWQASDRILAGFLTAIGTPTRAIPIDGYGTFDGVVLNELRRPRIRGTFVGEHMKAFDVVWGGIRGAATIENSYADVTDLVVTAGESTLKADGRFSLGFPRKDGGPEIDANIRIDRRPVKDLRHAFEIDDYNLDGTLSGDFHVTGAYLRPFGSGSLTITDGVAYGQAFERVVAAVGFEGTGARLTTIDVRKGAGRGTGAALISWNGTYSFNFDARDIPLETVEAVKGWPLTGVVDFLADGTGSFDAPRYDVRGKVRDLFIADEGIGQLAGALSIASGQMTVRLDASSPRLVAAATGRIALTRQLEADLSLRVVDTSLDPYIRAFEPRLSPFTTAVASGSARVVGELANPERLNVDATVDRLDIRLFDYAIRNAAPVRVRFDDNVVNLAAMQLIGQDTALDLSGTLGLADRRLAAVAKGDANLGILQGFIPNVRSSGRAVLSATFTGDAGEPAVSGTMTIRDGRIRHFGLPRSLERVSGAVRFDSRTIRLDDLTGEIGDGPVRFGGTIAMDGYRPGRLDVTMTGTDMRLRFPEGVRSRVDATLGLQGTLESAVVSGLVTVRDALYTDEFAGGGSLLDLTPDAAPVAPAAGTPGEPALPVRFNVQIAAPGTLRVRNSAARVVAAANLQLQGTLDRPLLFGRAEVQRGEVTVEGKRYVITRGIADFNNPVRIQPVVDIEAETRVRSAPDTYRVTVRATGTLDRLSTFTLDSDPPLPQVEVMALLFSDVSPGTNAEFRRYGSVTPGEQLLRDRATRALTDTFSSEVGRVAQRALGVDTVQITPSLVDPTRQSARFDPGARVTLIKRLSERAYLTYSRSLASAGRDQIVLLEYDQSDRLSWIVSRNEDGTYAVDVRVRRTF